MFLSMNYKYKIYNINSIFVIFSIFPVFICIHLIHLILQTILQTHITIIKLNVYKNLV